MVLSHWSNQCFVVVDVRVVVIVPILSCFSVLNPYAYCCFLYVCCCCCHCHCDALQDWLFWPRMQIWVIGVMFVNHLAWRCYLKLVPKSCSSFRMVNATLFSMERLAMIVAVIVVASIVVVGLSIVVVGLSIVAAERHTVAAGRRTVAVGQHSFAEERSFVARKRQLARLERYVQVECWQREPVVAMGHRS